MLNTGNVRRRFNCRSLTYGAGARLCRFQFSTLYDYTQWCNGAPGANARTTVADKHEIKCDHGEKGQ